MCLIHACNGVLVPWSLPSLSEGLWHRPRGHGGQVALGWAEEKPVIKPVAAVIQHHGGPEDPRHVAPPRATGTSHTVHVTTTRSLTSVHAQQHPHWARTNEEGWRGVWPHPGAHAATSRSAAPGTRWWSGSRGSDRTQSNMRIRTPLAPLTKRIWVEVDALLHRENVLHANKNHLSSLRSTQDWAEVWRASEV